MATDGRQGRIFAVRFTPPTVGSLFEDEDEQLRTLLSPGAHTESYKREWRRGRVSIDDRILSGRIGFSGESGVAEMWDDEAKDFRDEPALRGLTTTFAVHLDRLTGLLQDRRPDITIDAVIRALQKILNDGKKENATHLKIEAYRRRVTYSTWRQSVTKVTRATFSVREPNPTWQGAKDLEELFAQTESQAARTDFQSDDGLNMDAPFIQQSQNHTERGYGESRYTGVIIDEDGEEHTSTYNSTVGVEEQSDTVPADSNGEVTQTTIRQHLIDMELRTDGESARPTLGQVEPPPPLSESSESEDTGEGESNR